FSRDWSSDVCSSDLAASAKIAGESPVEERKTPPAPAAAKLLTENNLSADQVEGSGKRGQVLKGDVLEAIAKGAPSQPSEAPVSEIGRASCRKESSRR